MKPFDLEKALAGEPVVRGDGRLVVELFKCKTAQPYPIIVIDERGALSTHLIDGKIDHGTQMQHLCLFMADKPKRTVRVVMVVQRHSSPLKDKTSVYLTSAAYPVESKPELNDEGCQRVEFDLEVEE